VFKGKLLCKLQTLLREQRVSIARNSGHERLRDASRRNWNVHIRRPLGGPEQVVNYFARYVRKIAISDHRLVSYDGQTVAFRYRDRAHQNRTKTAEVEALTFCRRFLQHVLPPRFVRIRRYGLLSNRVRQPLLERCRELLGVEPPLLLAPPGESRITAIRRIFGFEPDRCPTCKLGRLIVRAQWRATHLPLDAVIAALSPRAPLNAQPPGRGVNGPVTAGSADTTSVSSAGARCSLSVCSHSPVAACHLQAPPATPPEPPAGSHDPPR
jgi:hypothetical protein